MISFYLNTSQMLHLQILSQWGLGLQHIDFEGTQFSPQHSNPGHPKSHDIVALKIGTRSLSKARKVLTHITICFNNPKSKISSKYYLN